MTNKKGNLNLEILKIYKNASPLLIDLVKKMLDANPTTRISIDDAMRHQFFNNLPLNFEIISNNALSDGRLTT